MLLICKLDTCFSANLYIHKAFTVKSIVAEVKSFSSAILYCGHAPTQALTQSKLIATLVKPYDGWQTLI